MKRIQPLEETRQKISSLLAEGLDGTESPQSELVRLAARRIAEGALDAAAREVLGRDHYERRGEESRGYRNGYRKKSMKTAPRVRLIRAVEECFPRIAPAEMPRSQDAEHRGEAAEGHTRGVPRGGEGQLPRASGEDGRGASRRPRRAVREASPFGGEVLRRGLRHRRAIRTTNLLERLFVEERRRTRAAGVIHGERAVLKLMYAAMARASETWCGIKVTELDRRRLDELRSELALRHAKATAPAVRNEKLPSRVYSRTGT